MIWVLLSLRNPTSHGFPNIRRPVRLSWPFTDGDAGSFGLITYSLTGENAKYFTIDASGTITVTDPGGLDRERSPSLTLLVAASDLAPPGARRTIIMPVEILLEDINDNQPTFFRQYLPGYGGRNSTLTPTTAYRPNHSNWSRFRNEFCPALYYHRGKWGWTLHFRFRDWDFISGRLKLVLYGRFHNLSKTIRVCYRLCL